MTDDLYDVIIVGAGPAGGTAAYFLGEAGKRVLVLEKETLPRYKTCGGGLSRQFLQEQFPFSFDPIMQTQVDSITWALKGVVFTIPVCQGAIGMVMRDQLDSFILSHARVEVQQGKAIRSVVELEDRVTVETQDGEQFSARYLIGADGANSIVARSLGLRKRRTLAAAIEVEAPVSAEIMRRYGHQPVFIFGEMHWGYLWIFPKADHLSVGIAGLHPKPGELQAKLRKVMARYGISIEGVPLHGHPVPVYIHAEKISTRRCLLAGDAAGLVDPLTGEGIRFGIKSGRLAAEAILNERVDAYGGEVRRKISFDHSMTVWVGRFFYTFQWLCTLLGAPNPFTASAVVDLLSDRLSTAGFMLVAIVTLPIFLLTEITAGIAGLFGGPKTASRIRAAVYPEVINAAAL